MLTIEPCTVEGEPALALRGELTIYAVVEARKRLDPALDAAPGLRLDLAGVTELDSAGTQLLVWLKQEAHRRGRQLALCRHSPAVLEVFDLLKVAALFGDPILIAPSAKEA